MHAAVPLQWAPARKRRCVAHHAQPEGGATRDLGAGGVVVKLGIPGPSRGLRGRCVPIDRGQPHGVALNPPPRRAASADVQAQWVEAVSRRLGAPAIIPPT